ncbi:MAG: hypothetical protein ABFD07_07500 [Methanobacterium sp.]
MTLEIIVTRIEELVNKIIATIMAGYAKTTDLFSRDHTDLSNIGTRTHAQIDTFLDEIEAGNATVSAHASSHAVGGSDEITPESIGAAPTQHSHSATAHAHSFNQITGNASDNASIVEYVNDEIANHAGYGNHAANHSEGGSDPLTPENIGAATDDHEHQWSEIAGSDPSTNAVLDTYVKDLITEGLSGDQIETCKVSGTMVQTSGLTHTVSALEYKILGVDYTSTGGEVTFDAETSELKRIDVVYADNAGLIHILKGTAATYPIKPVVDNSYVEIASILIDGLNAAIGNRTRVFTIKLPSATTVAGRLSANWGSAWEGSGAPIEEGVHYPTGWLLSAYFADPTSLFISHALGLHLVDVKVYSIADTYEALKTERLLIGSAAYSGLIAPDVNGIIIESLATVQTTLYIHITLSDRSNA